MVGNFHLLPVAHMPHLQHPPLPATAPTPDLAPVNHADHVQSLEPPLDGLGRAPPLQPSSRGCFVSGAVVGALLGVLSAWLVVARGLGKESRERFWSRFGGADGWRAGRRQFVAGTQGERKVSAGGVSQADNR